MSESNASIGLQLFYQDDDDIDPLTDPCDPMPVDDDGRYWTCGFWCGADYGSFNKS